MRRRAVGWWWGAVCALLGCARPAPAPSLQGVAPDGAASAPASAASSEARPAASAQVVPLPSGAWAQSVRWGRLRDAAAQIDALSEADRSRAEVRLVRARVAAKLGDHVGARGLLDGLDVPMLGEWLARWRAESELEVGPFERAAAHFEAKGGARGWLDAALAFERAGRLDEARRAADRAVAAARGGSVETRARARRMKIAEASGARTAAVDDARWVSLHATDASAGEAAALLERLDPGWRPSATEQVARVERLAQAGQVDACLAALSSLDAAPAGLDELERLRVRGNALFKLRRHDEAAQVIAKLARRSGTADDALLAARALSRAHRDDEAITAYREVARKHPKSGAADEATYLASRLLLLLGKHAEAAASYARYLAARTPPRHRQAALLEMALCDVARGRPGKARAVFGTLARGEDARAENARLRELEGVAAMRAEDNDGAVAIFTDVARSQPLSWPALVARERLAQLGAPPPPIEPAPSAQPETLRPSLPPAVDLLRRLGLDDEAEDALRPAERSIAQAAGERGAEALCASYALLEPATRRYRVAQDQVKVDLVMRLPGPANRWAWECLYPRPYAEIVAEAERREGLPPGLLHAVMRQESSFDPDVVSPAHAVGLLQLLPTTARQVAALAGLPFDERSLVLPAVNVELGARYLASLLATWKGSVPLAVASYNAGPKAVSRWLERAGPIDVDLFVARIPYAETRTYVARVMGNFARYAVLAGGETALPRVPLAIDPTLRAEEGAF